MKKQSIVVLSTLLLATVIAIVVVGMDLSSSSSPIPTYTYKVVAAYPHDPNAFTEGLVYYNGSLYESTGLYGQSSLRQVDLETGAVQNIIYLNSSLFGEGCTIINNEIIQLTWQSHVGFVYTMNFTLLREFTYPTEGWGLTNNGSCLIMSDGTSTIYYLDPTTFAIIGEIHVHDNQDQVTELNGLDYINGTIFANVWLTNRIAMISPQTGQVVGWIDLTGLLPQNESQNANVLNGIAYDSANNRLFVTGKLWPLLFQIQLVPEN